MMPEIVALFLVPLAVGTAAGAIVNWIIEQSRARERRKKIIIALQAQVEVLPRINSHNQTATNSQNPPKHLLPMPYPVIPFETAFFSEDGISVSNETIQATTDYLLKAKELNILIEALRDGHFGFLEHGPIPANWHPTRKFVYDQSETEMPGRIENMKVCLAKE